MNQVPLCRFSATLPLFACLLFACSTRNPEGVSPLDASDSGPQAQAAPLQPLSPTAAAAVAAVERNLEAPPSAPPIEPVPVSRGLVLPDGAIPVSDSHGVRVVTTHRPLDELTRFYTDQGFTVVPHPRGATLLPSQGNGLIQALTRSDGRVELMVMENRTAKDPEAVPSVEEPARDPAKVEEVRARIEAGNLKIDDLLRTP